MLCLLFLAALLFWQSPLEAAPVPVRFAEGMVRGFLVLSDTGGIRIASGDLLCQVTRASEIKSRVVFHFKDGSVQDEAVVFTQRRAFVMKSYYLLQKGPAFSDDMEVSLERATGKYLVKIKSHKDGRENVLDGKIELPLDVYNGLIPVVVKNLKGSKETVHMVAFTPKPRVIELDIIPSGEDKLLIGDINKTALHYVLKPKLGLLTIPAELLGRTPPDNHIWVISTDVPAFVKFEGPQAFGGPIWRIELTSPIWPK